MKFDNINLLKETQDMKEKTYSVRKCFGNGEVEVTFAGGESYEWINEDSIYLFSCLVENVETLEIGKCYGEITKRDYNDGVDVDDILDNPEEYHACVEFDC